MDYQFAYQVNQLARLVSSGQAEKIKPYVLGLDASLQQKLEPWLKVVLSDEQPFNLTSQPDNLQLKDYQATAKGWAAYYQHDYPLAHTYFEQAIAKEGWQTHALNSALGLAKVYTRTGHWDAARDWCLYYLSLARQQSYHFDIAKGYGALAEIFLRASYPKEALACFQTAYHLMPLGQGQQAKQYNFLASALLRNQEFLRAEVLLHTSRQLSRNALDLDPSNSGAWISLCHSSLRFAYLKRMQPTDNVTPDTNDEEALLAGKVNPNAFRVPLGLLQVAKGLALLPANTSKAKAHFTQAKNTFGPQLLMEYHWANALENACDTNTNQGLIINPQLESTFALTPLPPPAFTVVVDATWQNLPLHNQGFLPLVKATTLNELAELWTLFFI